MTGLAKSLLFLSSFAPLFALLGIRYLADVPLGGGLLLAALLVGCGGVLLIGWVANGGQQDTFVVERVDNRAEALTGYLVGYLFPFLVLDVRDISSVTATVAFFALLGFVYIKGDLLYLNPTLMLFGWSIWSAQARRADDPTDRRDLTVIVNAPRLEAGMTIATHALGAGIRVAGKVGPR